jgi:hypothetical protein
MKFSKKARFFQHASINAPEKGKTKKRFRYGKEIVSDCNFRGKEGGDIGKKNSTYF